MTYSNTQFYVSNHVDLTIIPPRIPWNPYNDEQMLVVVCFNYSLMNVYDRNNSQPQTITDAKRYIILMYSPIPTTSIPTLLVVKYCNEFCCVYVGVYGSVKQRQPKNPHDTTPLHERPAISRWWGSPDIITWLPTTLIDLYCCCRVVALYLHIHYFASARAVCCWCTSGPIATVSTVALPYIVHRFPWRRLPCICS